MLVILITGEENIESEAAEVESLPMDSLRNVFDGSVYRCYMPGSNPPEIPEDVTENAE